MREKPSEVRCCATWKIFCSATSSSSSAVWPPRNASATISVETSISRRRSAFSLTIFAWYSTFADVGTASTRKPM
jgi:hypothetical protein